MNKYKTFGEIEDKPTRTRHMETFVLKILTDYNNTQDKREAMDNICDLLNNEIKRANNCRKVLQQIYDADGVG